jgi:2'-5' RNA ligase
MNNDYVISQKEVIRQIKDSIQKGQGRASFVKMRSDYENDDETCLTSVAFISKDIAKAISEKIIQPLKNIEPDHFYYSHELLHLTIKNIRTVYKPPLFNESDVVKVSQLFTEIVPAFKFLTFTFEDLILFPTSVSLIGYCNEALRNLVLALDSGLRKISVPDNKKYFSDTVFFGNITLCRLTHEPSLSFQNKVKDLENIYIGAADVQTIHLITCNSVCSTKTRKIIGTYQLS